MSDDNPALQAIKLRSFSRTILGDDVGAPAPDADGADAANARGVVFGDDAVFIAPGVRGLGAAMQWASVRGASRLHLVSEDDTAADLARRAELLDGDVTVWRATGPELERAEARPAIEPPARPESHWALAGLITEAGARAVDDHGVLVAEIAGLEVARVIEGDDGPRLDVGVGQADRELQGYVHGHLDDDSNLRRAIAAVVGHRRLGANTHPLSRIARQRWLRSVLLDDPTPIDVGPLRPVVPLRPRETVLDTEPTAAAGDGVVVVCSVGVDLDLLPEAADYRHRVDPEAEIVIVVPERDRRLASTLADRIERLRVVSIDEPWAARDRG